MTINVNRNVLKHQIKYGYDEELIGGKTFYFVNSCWSSKFHIHISGSSYPLDIDFDNGIVFVGTNVRNVNNGNYMFDQHKNLIVYSILSKWDDIGDENFENRHIFSYKKIKKPYLADYNKVQFLLEL